MKLAYLAVVSVFTLGVISGCKSTTSFFMSRFDNDRLVGNSNGDRGVHENAKPFKGIPITMKVPTHVDVTVYETIFLNTDLLQVITERRNLHATADIVYSDKIFSVDPKRAAAGNSNYTFEMNSNHADPVQRQYFKQVKQHIEDETIRDVNAALSSLLPLISKKPKAKQTSGTEVNKDAPPPPPETRDRVVAWKRFDVNSVDFEEQVKQFVELHINSCHSCSQNQPICVQSMEPSINEVHIANPVPL